MHVPNPDLHAVLRQRFLEAAVDHPDIQVVLYEGRPESFPSEIFELRHNVVSWSPITSRRSTPIHVHIASYFDASPPRTEILAFFGEQTAFERLTQLARAAIGASEGWLTPDGHGLSVATDPAAAWCRSLFQRGRDPVRHLVTWDANQPKKTDSAVLGTRSFNPLTDRVMDSSIARGRRPYGCVASQLFGPVFSVSAGTVGQPPRGFLDMEVYPVDRLVRRRGQEAIFARRTRPWQLFNQLWNAGEPGSSRQALRRAIWPDGGITDNALDQNKRAVDDLLLPLHVEVQADRGTWRLGLLT